jgi:autotransporter-associated beta strand protein
VLFNSGAIAGNTGGNGGSSTYFNAGNGGVGGGGVQFTASNAALFNSGAIAGGSGGNGGSSQYGFAGNGGDGGVGVEFTGSNSGATLTNSGTIMGGQGGTPATGGAPNGTAGAGGAGIVGAGLTVINSGSIAGGLDGDGVTRADAIDFTGGTNSLTLLAGSTITGNVHAYSAADTLVLGGRTNSSFDVSEIGATAQYEGFGVFEKTGSSTWTLTGSTNSVTPWAINRGTLAVSADNNLGAASGGLGFAGGALQFLSSFTTSRVVTLNTGGGIFDTDGNNANLAGLIGGTGDLIKVGAGTLTLSDTNGYSGGTSLDGGTLDLAAVGAAGKTTITFAKGSEILKIENAALSADTFGNTIHSFGVGDVIDLPGLAFATGATALFNSATHKLAVTSNGVTDILTLANPAFTKFVAISDGGDRS